MRSAARSDLTSAECHGESRAVKKICCIGRICHHSHPQWGETQVIRIIEVDVVLPHEYIQEAMSLIVFICEVVSKHIDRIIKH